MPSDAAGLGFSPAPLPNIPQAVGSTFFAQAIFLEAPGYACGASTFHLIASDGVQLTVLP